MADAAPSPLEDAPELEAILALIRGIGLRVIAGPLTDATFVPAMTVRDGALTYDPTAAGWVGDLLHEAGHLAVTAGTTRDALARIEHDPSEEMAAIAWSFAAATAIGLPMATLFHAGYAGGPDYLIEAFAGGNPIGLPMLQHWGMAGRSPDDGPPYPAMKAWLRP